MARINITRDGGQTMIAVEDSTLTRTVQFTDAPGEFTVTVEWRESDLLVRRDAHVILKQPSEAANALVGAL